MPRDPLVTVLLATHNDLRFLPEAVDSVLAQSLSDFELLIVDDGSTDDTAAYLGGLHDPRLRIITNPQNLGLTPSLNLGLDAARGTYIARLDADDIAEPDRLHKQIEFLDAHPDVAVLGTARTLIDERGAVTGRTTPAEDDLDIRWRLLLGNPFGHPTVTLRRDVLLRHALRYDPAFRTAQDYELWTRLLPHARGHNLPDPLVRYRLRDGISRSRRTEQLANHDRIARLAFRRLLPDFPIQDDDVTQLRGRYGGASVRDPDSNPADVTWIARLTDVLTRFCTAYAGRAETSAFHERQRAWIDHLARSAASSNPTPTACRPCPPSAGAAARAGS